MRIQNILFGLCMVVFVCHSGCAAYAASPDGCLDWQHDACNGVVNTGYGDEYLLTYGTENTQRDVQVLNFWTPPFARFPEDWAANGDVFDEGQFVAVKQEVRLQQKGLQPWQQEPFQTYGAVLVWIVAAFFLIALLAAFFAARKIKLWRVLLRKTNQMDLLAVDLKRSYVTSFLHFSMFAGHLPQKPSLHLDHWAQFFKIPMPGHYLEGMDKRVKQNRRQWKNQPFQATLSHGQGAGKLWYQEDGSWTGYKMLQLNLLDITNQKKKALELEVFMGIDPVTELYDRRVLRDKLKDLLEQYPQDEAVMCFVTLSDFEKFQEQYGVEAADMMLLEAGRTLRTLAPSRSAHFHIVNGEFCLCVAGVDTASPWSDPEAMLRTLRFEIRWCGQCLSLDSACGYSLYPLHADSVEGLVERANFTMKMARQDPAHPIQRYNEEYFHSHRNFRFRLQEYNNVMENCQVYPVFQPIYHMETGALFGYEALSRVLNPSFSNILQLLEVAELKGDLYRLNLLLLESIITDYPWEDYPGIRLFFNFDIGSVENMEHFASRIHGLFTKIQFANSAIEITERHSTKDQMGLFDVIRRFREGGSIVVIDDYGTGYSNESSLVRIQPDIVKLDREMVKDIESDAYKQHFVAQFMDFSKQTGMLVLGEGIETEAEKKTLMELGVHFGQGYYLGRPVKLERRNGVAGH